MRHLNEVSTQKQLEIYEDPWRMLENHGLSLKTPDEVLYILANTAGVVLGVSCAPVARQKALKEFTRLTKVQMNKFPLKLEEM